jgi:hypothetical protein
MRVTQHVTVTAVTATQQISHLTLLLLTIVSTYSFLAHTMVLASAMILKISLWVITVTTVLIATVTVHVTVIALVIVTVKEYTC